MTRNAEKGKAYFEECYALIKEAIGASDSLALFDYGALHDHGCNTPQNQSVAAKYYERAAALGNQKSTCS